MAQPPPSSPCLRVLDTAIVTPSGPALPVFSLPLTILDLQWLHFPPVERIFFYRLAPDADIAGILAGLKNSLSTALRVFFPLAGHVRLTPGTAIRRRYDLFYQPGDGVAFTLARYDADVHDLASDQPRQVAEMANLLPRLPDGGALLAVQASVLLQSRGLALGVTVHHVACDGAGSTNFLHTWAAACTGTESPTPPPVIDRTLIADPNGLYDHYTKNFPSTKEIEFVKMSPGQLVATFTLSREHLQRVKDAVASEAARRGQPPPRCSTLVAALGFIWSCYCRAKAEAGTELAYFIVAVDHRPWMKPPVPATYLGNCIGSGIGAASKKELASAGAGGLLTACSAIAAGIEKAIAAGIEKALASPEWETLMERLKEVGARGVLSVAGSPRFHVYGIDFGFGRPAKVNIVSVARTGAMAVAEARDGGGGMEVGISLPPAGMERFQKCFAEAIEWLS